ncbi:MAG TPA: hypothetical protein VJH23_04950 [archaeon]|nr:hypothetical protein [archaeon]
MASLGIWIERIVLLSAAFIAILFFYTLFKVWSEGKLHYFLFLGDFESAGVVFLVMIVIGAVLKWLWKLEVHTLFKPRTGRRVR